MGLDFDLWAEIRRKSDGKPVTHTKMLKGESPQFHVFWSGDYDIMNGVIDTLNRCCGTSYDVYTGSMDVPFEALLPIYRYLLSRCDLGPDDAKTKEWTENPDPLDHPLFTEQQNLYRAQAVHDIIIDVLQPQPWGLSSDAPKHMTEADAEDYETHPEQYEWHFKITNWW